MAGPQAWPHCDEDIKSFIETLIGRLKDELENELTGIYLHGSLAMGSYYRPKSDIDVIVVVKDKLNEQLAEKVGVAIANESTNRPTIGNVELSVITAKVAKQVPIPMPFEVHYSSMWHEKIISNQVDYSIERTDVDLASHLTYVLQRGICLYGKPVSEIFGEVKWNQFMASVMDDLHWILEDEHLLETPVYGMLNICRVFQLLSKDSQTVYSKDEGGEWGLEHLPEAFQPLIQQSLDVYRSSEEVNEENRLTGGKEWAQDELLEFRNYARHALKEVSL